MPGVEYSSASKGVGVRKQAQISPPPFFLRLSPVGGSGWEPSTPAAAKSTVTQVFSCSGSSSDGKIHRRRRCSAVRAAAAAGKNPPTPAKSTADAGVQLFGQQHSPKSRRAEEQQRRQCSAVRADLFFAAVALRRQRLGAIHSDGRIHRRRRGSAGRGRGQQHSPKSRRARRAAAAAVFSCSGGSFFCGCRLTAAAAGSHPADGNLMRFSGIFGVPF